MDRKAHRSSHGGDSAAAMRLRAWAGAGVLAAIAIVAFSAAAVAPASATSGGRSAGSAMRDVHPACAIGEKAAFRPPRVVEGHNAHLVVVLSNCTGSPRTVELTRFGQLACIVADPVSQQIALGPHTTRAVRFEYLAPSCAGSGHITARVTSSAGKILASRVATLEVLAPPPAG